LAKEVVEALLPRGAPLHELILYYYMVKGVTLENALIMRHVHLAFIHLSWRAPSLMDLAFILFYLEVVMV
jgi:hypothetical protein